MKRNQEYAQQVGSTIHPADIFELVGQLFLPVTGRTTFGGVAVDTELVPAPPVGVIRIASCFGYEGGAAGNALQARLDVATTDQAATVLNVECLDNEQSSLVAVPTNDASRVVRARCTNIVLTNDGVLAESIRCISVAGGEYSAHWRDYRLVDL